MLKKIKIKQSGFTLIELLISVLLSIVAVSAIMFFYMTIVTSSYQTLKASKLNQELATLMTLVSQDVRRAGFWNKNNSSLDDDRDNPYANYGNQSYLQIFKSSSSTSLNDLDVAAKDWDAGDCVLYAYDLDASGGDSLDTSEIFGFKLDENTIKILNGGGSVDNCSSGTWEELIDSNEIVIESFSVDLSDSVCVNSSFSNDDIGYNCFGSSPISEDILVWSFNVKIDMSGSLADDPDTSMTLSREVTVRNKLLRLIP